MGHGRRGMSWKENIKWCFTTLWVVSIQDVVESCSRIIHKTKSIPRKQKQNVWIYQFLITVYAFQCQICKVGSPSWWPNVFNIQRKMTSFLIWKAGIIGCGVTSTFCNFVHPFYWICSSFLSFWYHMVLDNQRGEVMGELDYELGKWDCDRATHACRNLCNTIHGSSFLGMANFLWKQWSFNWTWLLLIVLIC